MTVASSFGAQMTTLTGNTGGQVNQLPPAYLVDGKGRSFNETITLAAQASGSVIGVARIPLLASLQGITVVASVSLGTTTISFGDTNNATLYGAATTVTTTNAKNFFATSGTFCQAITQGYDSVTGNLMTPFLPGSGGALYEDIVMTTAVAALPASGTLAILTEFTTD